MPCTLLCSAENFGFGPAAALQQLVSHMPAAGLVPEYAGSGITLDLHRDSMHTAVHDIDVRTSLGRRSLRRLLRKSQRLLTVCDVHAAEVGCAAGADVVFYDILAWFRRPLPDVYHSVALLLCPNFFGLQRNLDTHAIRNATVVPPLVPPALSVSPSHRQRILINLGGLHTPYTSDVQCAAYAQLMIDCIRRVSGVDRPVVLVSDSIGALLTHCAVRTVSTAEARRWLASCDMAFITSGLGNICDAAGQGVPVCLLPPMSDSQGQQAIALRERRWVPMAIDWSDLREDLRIDYWASKQQTMPAIVHAVHSIQRDTRARERLCSQLEHFCRNVAGTPSRLQQEFRNVFGADDGSQAVRLIAQHYEVRRG